MKRLILLTFSILLLAEIGLAQSFGRNGSSAFRGGSVTLALKLSNGLVATPSLTFSSDLNSGLFWTSADLWGATVGGREIVRFRNGGATTTTQFIISPGASLGAAGTPSLAFNDGTIGIRAVGTSSLFLITGGAEQFEVEGNHFHGRTSGGGGMRNVTASSTNPTILAYRGDLDTGLGWAGADALSVVAGGVEGIRITEAARIDVAVNGAVNYAADGQADDDYEVAIPAITANGFVAGLTVTFLANTANTGGATLEITSVGDLDAILKQHDVALADNDIEAGQIVVVVFDGTNWQMVSQIAN